MKKIVLFIIEKIRKALKVDEKGNSFGWRKGMLLFAALMMAGCSEVKYTKYQTTTQDVGVFEYDSCEYITIYSGVSHKGNCRFCKERDSIKWEKRKKELEELVKQLKEK